MPRVLAVFVIAQIIGWGTTIYLPAVLVDRLTEDVRIPPELVFSAVSIMLLTSAALAPAVGRAFDRHGTRRFLPWGSVMLGVGLTQVAAAEGYLRYAFGWALMGAGMALCLSMAMSTTYTALYGVQARRYITLSTFFTGVTATIFMPLTEYLATRYGWRTMLYGYAALNIGIAAPLYIWGIPWRRTLARLAADDAELSRHAPPLVPPHLARNALVLLAIAFALNNMVAWGTHQQMVELFKDGGFSAAMAVFIVGLKGPAQVAGRLGDLAFGQRLTPMAVTRAALAMMLAALLLLLVAPFSLATALVFVLLWGISDGVMTIMRSALALQLFGRDGYGTMMGRLLTPLQLASALAPILFASLMARAGGTAMLAFAASASLISLVALLGLVRLITTAPASR
jgi:predicted MFS family arabinose efflux permease